MPNNHQPANKVKLGRALYFDCSAKRLSYQQKTIELNRAEREVLYTLAANCPRMVSKAELLKAGWARKEVAPTSLFQTIRNLRIKLKEEEKGQIIELVPKLGYKLNAVPVNELPSHSKTQDQLTNRQENTVSKPNSKRIKTIAVIMALACLTVIFGLYTSQKQEQFYHQLVTDDDNNTIVFLSNNENDLIFLKNHNDKYITPKEIRNKLFFISKSKEYYSIAFCDKNTQNICDPGTARAVTFKHFDLSSFWPLLTEESLSIGAMSVYKGETTIKASAKSYNLYLENGTISPNLSQFFIHKAKPYTWTFTGISYRMNNDQTEFVPISFKGGTFTLQKTAIEPFIAAIKTKPDYFYWINSKEELNKMGVKLPGKVESYVDSLYAKTNGYDSYMLYRQPDLYLWFSDEVGFYWFSKQGQETSYFPEFLQFHKCKDYLELYKNPDCN